MFVELCRAHKQEDECITVTPSDWPHCEVGLTTHCVLAGLLDGRGIGGEHRQDGVHGFCFPRCGGFTQILVNFSPVTEKICIATYL